MHVLRTSQRGTYRGEMERQRGFGLIEIIVGVGVLSLFVLLTALSWSRPPKVHAAALELQAALTEARSLALTSGQISFDPRLAGDDGATVTITPAADDPLRASIITVYRSRPQRNADPLSIDTGFPPIRVPVVFTIAPDGDGNGGSEPFGILVSSAGYASFRNGWPTPPYPPQPGTYFTTEQPCSDTGEAISVSDGSKTETHPFTCREGTYDVSVSPS